MKTRQEALHLMQTWIQSDSLRKHCLAVAASMEGYAKHYQLKQEEIDLYWMTGLLHDFDYEKYPTLEHHPSEGSKILKQERYPPELIEAIMGHGNHTGVPRQSKMAKTLFAVDELSGLLVALAKVRADRFDSMTPASVEKCLKKKEFAKAISREDIEQGIRELEVDRTKHFELVIASLKAHQQEVGF